MRRLAGVMGVLMLAACSGPGGASTALNQRFSGSNANDFFLSYGQPVDEKPLENGEKQYRWVSVEQGEQTPAAVFHSYPTAGGLMPMAQSATPAGIELYCELKIGADGNDRIRSIAIVYDSRGKWSNSRCGELFSVK